jgi:hypothetical protein
VSPDDVVRHTLAAQTAAADADQREQDIFRAVLEVRTDAEHSRRLEHVLATWMQELLPAGV